MAWTFDGVLLPDGVAARMEVGSGAASPLPGRYAVAGLVDAHCHLTVAVDSRGPYLDGSIAGRRLDEFAAAGVGLVRSSPLGAVRPCPLWTPGSYALLAGAARV